MNATIKASLASLLNRAAFLFFVIAGMAFWFGGDLICAVFLPDRFFAAMGGIGLAALFGGFGVLAIVLASGLETGEGMISPRK
jgi:hypothetical protein